METLKKTKTQRTVQPIAKLDPEAYMLNIRLQLAYLNHKLNQDISDPPGHLMGIEVIERSTKDE